MLSNEILNAFRNILYVWNQSEIETRRILWRSPAMLFGDPVRVKDSILSIPVPPISSGGGMNSTSTYYVGTACDALFFILPTPNILMYVHIFNHFIKFFESLFSWTYTIFSYLLVPTLKWIYKWNVFFKITAILNLFWQQTLEFMYILFKTKFLQS